MEGLHETTSPPDCGLPARAGARRLRSARRGVRDRLGFGAAAAVGQTGDHGDRHRHHARSEASNTLIPRARAKISMRVAPGGDAAAHLDALTAHLQQHAPWGAQVTVTPRRHRPAIRHRRQRRRVRRGARRRSGRRGAPSRSTWAWADRSRSSPSSPPRSRRRRSSSPVSRIRRPRRTASTRACTWACWSGPRSPRRCCSRTSDQTDRSRRSLATWPVARMLYCATSIVPFSSTTKVERITPWTVLPYIVFSP